MEFHQLIKILIKNKKSLIFTPLAGILLGSLVYFLPNGYTASGSIYVGRITDRNSHFFTYEGYYGQQTALSYTNSVLAFIQSTDLLRDTLVELGIPTTDYQIWKLKQSISVKKSGPQTPVINLSVKAKSGADAEKLWNLIFNNTDMYANRVSVQSDPSLKIYKVSENPVVRSEFKSLPLFIVAGMGLGLACLVAVTVFTEYFKENKNDKAKH
ncbi:hypothetical protein GYA27_03550 [candidate division WWE3 bacterium]|uniref:Polysaccharide chain length determinant N-terminal domain-containing protein n=1 Tax=candidate division WWE3 bacterium TaxID=2053526 RepID=A0A7X9DKU8_UNCKA|nr:hypothetical protein [candidate division WWE3 bacterium]